MLKKLTRTRVLLQVLKIESVLLLYLKHKIFFLKQIYKNILNVDIFIFLKSYFKGKNIPQKSFWLLLKIEKINLNITFYNKY